MTKQVDIIIPVHNRPEHTRQTLETLFKNTDPKLYRLHVVDDASDFETAEILRAYADCFDSFIIHDQAIGPGASRNEMAEEISQGFRAKYLYLSDNDVYFTSGWLEKLLKAFEHFQAKGVLLLGGGCHPYLQNSTRLYTDMGIVPLTVGIKDAVSGYSQLMTWETWDTFGPLDEGTRGLDKKIAGSEDWAFCQKIIKAGFLVGSLEPEVIIHTGKTNTYGEPATGSETFKDIEGVNVK